MKTVIEMAREAGKEFGLESMPLHPVLERFAELIRADEQKKWQTQTAVEIHEAILDERETCAKVCDDLPAPERMSLDNESLYECATLDCADAIRARSNT